MRSGAPLFAALFLLGLAGCSHNDALKPAKSLSVPKSDDTAFYFPAGATADELRPAVDAGLADEHKGPDFVRFVVIQSGDRLGPRYAPQRYHVVVGGGVEYPVGSLRILKDWLDASGEVDGRNEQCQTMGVSVAVERGTPRPYDPRIVSAVTAFCEALFHEVPHLAPDVVLAMGEIPGTRHSPADGEERRLAEAARRDLPQPASSRFLTLTQGETHLRVGVEVRDTPSGRQTGMMFRKSFPGPNRGMLFVYPTRNYHGFYMRNCYFPIDLAYIYEGKIDQVFTMQPQAGAPDDDLQTYESRSAVRYVLELPGGWLAHNKLGVGAVVGGLQ